MIVDHIRNRELYYFLGEDFKKALDYFATVISDDLQKNDIGLSDCDVLIKVRPMDTKQMQDCSFEAHKKYADIHFVAYGKEKIAYNDVKNLEFINYDDAKDMISLVGTGDAITLYPGYFMIMLKDDAHMPCICVDKPEKLGKLIAKIKI